MATIELVTRIAAPVEQCFDLSLSVDGPFASWWHEHRFVEDDGTTVMTDLAVYTAPVGLLGGVVDAMVLRRRLERLLRLRNEWLRVALERPRPETPGT